MQHTILTVWAMSLAVVGAHSDEPWQPVGLGGSGGMFALAVSPLDPQLMMVNCDMSGAYITRDGGRTWHMIDHRMLSSSTRCSPLFHPTVPGRIYAISGDANELRLSEDAGITWRPLLKDRPPWRGPIWLVQAAADEPGSLFVGAGDETFVTLDGGSIWHR